jgi:enoyl-CoA hydratase
MPYENLLVEQRDGIAVVTVNRPKVLNALNARTIEELDACFAELQQEAPVRAVVITGAGEKAFVAGADINELAAYSPREGMECSLRGQHVFNRIENLGKPTIAAINGHALGGGFELALACSIRIAGTNARLGLPEVKLGLIPGYGGSQRLPRLVGKGIALQVILTGEPLTAEEGLRCGLVNQVVAPDQLLATAEAIARKIAANAPLAIQHALEAVNRGLNMPLEDALRFEAALFGMSFSTDDMREGTRAFLEKREPRFQGR